METVCGFAVKETLSRNHPRAFYSCGLKRDVHTHGKESAIKIGKKRIAVRNCEGKALQHLGPRVGITSKAMSWDLARL